MSLTCYRHKAITQCFKIGILRPPAVIQDYYHYAMTAISIEYPISQVFVGMNFSEA